MTVRTSDTRGWLDYHRLQMHHTFEGFDKKTEDCECRCREHDFKAHKFASSWTERPTPNTHKLTLMLDLLRSTWNALVCNC